MSPRPSAGISVSSPLSGISAESDPWNRRDWLWLGAVFVFALGLRVFYWQQVSGEIWFTNPLIDSEHYHRWAQDILRGDWLGKGAFEHSPLYAYFLAFCYKVIGVNVAWVAAFQLGMGAVCCGLIYVLARRFFSPLTAVLAGLAQAVYGIAFFHEGTLLTMVLIEFLNLLLLLTTYWAIQKADWKFWAIPGFILGLSFLARPNISIYLGVLVLWIGLLKFKQGWAWLLKAWIILGVVFMLTILPASVRNMIVLHEWMLSVPHAGMNFYIGNSKWAKGYHTAVDDGIGLTAKNIADDFKARAEKELGRKITYAESSSFWYQKAWHDIGEDPGHWQRVLLNKFLLFFNHYEYTTSLNFYAIREITPFYHWPWLSFKWVAPLAVLGMFWLRKRWKELLPLHGLVLAYLAGNLIIMVSSEYRYAVMQVFFIFAAYSVVELVRMLRAKNLSALVLALVLLTLVFILANLEVIGKDERDYHMASAHSNFGGLLARLENFQGASEEYSVAKSLVKHQPQFLSAASEELGNTYIRMQKWEEARKELEEAYALTPDDVTVMDDLATVATAQGRYAEAIRFRKQVLELAPGEARYYLNLGMTYSWAGNDREADQAFAEAVRLSPNLEQHILEKRAEILEKRKLMRRERR